MKACLLASAMGVAAAATAPPRIELDLHEVRVFQLNTPITRVHDLGFTQPDGSSVGSKQKYSARCGAGDSTATTCPLPYARAWDHQDQELTSAIQERLFLVDRQPITGPAVASYTRVTSVDYSQRGTYLFRYDVADKSGNKAEQVVFALVLDDTHAPVIQMCGGVEEDWEAASDSKLCTFSSAYDNIDHDISDRIRYTVEQISAHADDQSGTYPKTLGTDVDINAAKALITTNHIDSRFIVTLKVCDNARKYGAPNSVGTNEDNCATTQKGIDVKDTIKPWFKLHGSEPAVHECAVNYVDQGATASDALDTELRGQTITVTPTSTVVIGTVGDYTVKYNAQDAAGHNADERTRRVQVRDTTDPNVSLIGLSEIVHYAGATFTDPGSTCTDTCDGTNVNTVFSWSRQFNDQVLGDYLRTYCCTDQSSNEACIVRKFTVVDNTAPMLTIVGDEVETLEATRDTEFTDQGATCHDYVDGTLSHAVEVSGNVVNMRIPGKYVIRYDCQDLSGNQAMPLNRTVYVRDTTCPTITLKGVGVIYLESGFNYIDAGATATDDLDGDITPVIQVDGDTVDTSANYFMRQSCADIHQSTSNAKTGEYYINVAGTRTLVWCDFTNTVGATYFAVQGGTRVVPYQSGVDGSCATYGMEMATLPASSAARTHAEAKFGSSYFPSAGADSDAYLCTTNVISDKGNFKNWASATDSQHAFAGKYVIEYHVQDRAGNNECDVIRRTVIVKDLIPNVITTHLRNELDGVNKNDVQGEIDRLSNSADQYEQEKGLYGKSPAHKSWPLFSVQSGFGGKAMMAESVETSSTNGWVIGAAASAVTGLALLGYASRKQAVTSVPV